MERNFLTREGRFAGAVKNLYLCFSMEKKKRNPLQRLVLGLMRLLGRLPKGFHFAMADFIAWFARRVLHYREQVVTTNLARSFPELKYWELEPVAKEFYRHFADLFAEMVRYSVFRGEKGRKRLRESHMLEVKDVSLVNRLLENTPSVMVLNSHLGNWELFGGISECGFDPREAFALRPEQIVAVYKELTSKFSDGLFEAVRLGPLEGTDFGGYIESSQIMRYAFGNRDKKRFYMFNTDQYPYGNAAYTEVDFLHQPTRVMLGGATLACKLHYSVVYLHWSRPERGRYEASFIPICEDASTMTPEAVMAEFYRLLAENIAEDPAMYLWSHKRWK